MRKTVWAFAFALIALLVVATSAQARIKDGQSELGFFGEFTSTEGFSVLLGQVTYGKFVSRNSQIGGSVTGLSSDAFELVGVSAFYRYHFSPDAEVVPYVGAQAGVVITDISTSGSIGGSLGVKNFVSENLSVNYEGDVVLTFGDVSTTTFLLTVGLSYYF
jgi:hypothetical protein